MGHSTIYEFENPPELSAPDLHRETMKSVYPALPQMQARLIQDGAENVARAIFCSFEEILGISAAYNDLSHVHRASCADCWHCAPYELVSTIFLHTLMRAQAMRMGHRRHASEVWPSSP
jgi:hypothetical protein